MHFYKILYVETTFSLYYICLQLHTADDTKTLSENSEYVLTHCTSRKQLTYDSTSGTAESCQRTSDNGNGNGLKWLATDSSNVHRSPRGHTSSKCPRYDPYTSKQSESASHLIKESEDPHNSSGGVVSDTDLASLVAPNSVQKSRKSGDENLISSYLFDETDTDIRTSMPMKEEGSDEMKMTKMLFVQKSQKTKEEDAKWLKAKLLDENCCLLRNPELGSDSFFVGVAHFISECEGLGPADKVSQLRLRLTQWLSTKRILFSEVSI